MQISLIVTLVLHTLAGVFWAGGTFALARTAGASADRFFGPQMGAALVAILSGGYLWHLLNPSGFGRPEQVLAIGALCAILAAGVQALLCAAQPYASVPARLPTTSDRRAASFSANGSLPSC